MRPATVGAERRVARAVVRAVVGALACAVTTAPPLAAQAVLETDSQPVTPRPARDAAVRGAPRGGLELWGGLADNSPQWGILGETPDMALGLVAVRYSRALGRPGAPGTLPRLEWTIDLVPLARTSPAYVSLRGSGLSCERANLCVAPQEPRGGDRFPPGSAWGIGLTPIGLTRRFLVDRPVSPFVGVNGGALLFDRHVPTTQSTRFNFTASAELGLRLGPPGEPGLTLSYRFHHISNAGTAGENPGLASHLIALGVHRPLLAR